MQYRACLKFWVQLHSKGGSLWTRPTPNRVVQAFASMISFHANSDEELKQTMPATMFVNASSKVTERFCPCPGLTRGFYHLGGAIADRPWLTILASEYPPLLHQ